MAAVALLLFVLATYLHDESALTWGWRRWVPPLLLAVALVLLLCSAVVWLWRNVP